MLYKLSSLVLALGFAIKCSAQPSVVSDHYDNMSKVYTVIICAALVILAIAAYLFYLERRVSSLERRHQEEGK